jgi:hypothetical protein
VICKTCGSQRRREDVSCDPIRLVYQDDGVKLSFGALLRQSLRAHLTAASGVSQPDMDEWCDRCGNKQPSRSHPTDTVASSLPPMLMLFSNLGKTAASNCEMWKSAGGRAAVVAPSNVVNSILADDGGEGLLAGGDGPNVSTWLPSSVRVSVDAAGNVLVEEISSEGSSSNSAPGHSVVAVYNVTALVCHIHDPRKMPGPGHSVLHQKISAAYTQDKSLVKSFFMFNDFHVVRTNAREALHFDGTFKNACVLLLTRSETDEMVPPVPIRNPVSWQSFLEPPLGNGGQQRAVIRSEEDLPKPGELLPIDAEFVCLQPDVIKVSLFCFCFLVF